MQSLHHNLLLAPPASCPDSATARAGGIRTICGACADGCAIEYAISNGGVIEAHGCDDGTAGGAILCVHAMSDWNEAKRDTRLMRPLIRRDVVERFRLGSSVEEYPSGPLHKTHQPISWDAARTTIVQQLASVISQNGPDSVAGLASARSTNEESYLFQKLLRAAVGTNNIDHLARQQYADALVGLERAMGTSAMTNPIRDLRNADCILVVGWETVRGHAAVLSEVERAAHRGARVIVIESHAVLPPSSATLHLRVRPGTADILLRAMTAVIVREGWANAEFVETRMAGFADFATDIAGFAIEDATRATGIPAALIEQAARAYALGERRGAEQSTKQRGRSSALYGLTTQSGEIVRDLANLTLVCGHVGHSGAGVGALRSAANAQGVCDMGLLPMLLPGYQPVGDQAARRAMAWAWAQTNLPLRQGLSAGAMFEAAAAGQLHALLVLDDDLLQNVEQASQAETALNALDLLVVQSSQATATAALAHIVLPCDTWIEKSGSVTNTERRIQLLQPVIAAPGEVQPGWKILCELGQAIDAARGRICARWAYDSPAAVMREIAAVTIIFRGVSYERLQHESVAWPCLSERHVGTPVLYAEQFRGNFQ